MDMKLYPENLKLTQMMDAHIKYMRGHAGELLYRKMGHWKFVPTRTDKILKVPFWFVVLGSSGKYLFSCIASQTHYAEGKSEWSVNTEIFRQGQPLPPGIPPQIKAEISESLDQVRRLAASYLGRRH
jgi:hypothetical protein